MPGYRKEHLLYGAGIYMREKKEDLPSLLNEPYARGIMQSLVAGAAALDAIDRENKVYYQWVIDSEVVKLSQSEAVTLNDIGTIFVLRALPTIAFKSPLGKEGRYPFDTVSVADLQIPFFLKESSPCVFVTINPKTNKGYIITDVSEQSVHFFSVDEPEELREGTPQELREEIGFTKKDRIKGALLEGENLISNEVF